MIHAGSRSCRTSVSLMLTSTTYLQLQRGCLAKLRPLWRGHDAAGARNLQRNTDLGSAFLISDLGITGLKLVPGTELRVQSRRTARKNVGQNTEMNKKCSEH